MTNLFYIVTSRGASRDYATLVTIDGPLSDDSYLRAHEAAARINSNLAQCGTDVSAFRISEPKRKHWLELESKYAAALVGPPEALEELRRVQSERRRFLKDLT
jgi:hypothetical protein